MGILATEKVVKSKCCTDCKKIKPRSSFAVARTNRDGLYHQCKGCMNARARARYNALTEDERKNKALLNDFGITLVEFNRMLEEQGGVCKICKKPEIVAVKGKVRALSVDHCHTSGKIRGILCWPCNRALGLFLDDTRLLQAAIDYIKESECCNGDS